MKRRTFLQRTLTAGSVGLAVSSGLLTPRLLWADEKTVEAFKAESMDDALKGLALSPEESADITLKAPETAANGATVRVTASTTLENVSAISFFVEKNPLPLAARFQLGESVLPTASVLLKFSQTSNLLAVIETGDKAYSAQQEVKVTVGGCS